MIEYDKFISIYEKYKIYLCYNMKENTNKLKKIFISIYLNKKILNENKSIYKRIYRENK